MGPYILEVGGFKRMRPQPGNALQEGRDASEKGECWKRTCGVRLVFSSSSSLLRVLARRGCPEKIAALRAREIVRALRMSL